MLKLFYKLPHLYFRITNAYNNVIYLSHNAKRIQMQKNKSVIKKYEWRWKSVHQISPSPPKHQFVKDKQKVRPFPGLLLRGGTGIIHSELLNGSSDLSVILAQ